MLSYNEITRQVDFLESDCLIISCVKIVNQMEVNFNQVPTHSLHTEESMNILETFFCCFTCASVVDNRICIHFD